MCELCVILAMQLMLLWLWCFESMRLTFNSVVTVLLFVQPSVPMGSCVSPESRGCGRAVAPHWACQGGGTALRPLSQMRVSAEWAGPLPVPLWNWVGGARLTRGQDMPAWSSETLVVECMCDMSGTYL